MTLATLILIDHDDSVLERRKPGLEAAGLRTITWPWTAATIPTLRPGPELILLDLASLDGQSLAEFVLMATKIGGRCVVVVSDQSAEELDELAHSAGLLGWIPKSIGDDEFVNQVRDQLRRKQRFTGRNEPLGPDVLDAIRGGSHQN
ncbi:MAG: response regulator transcription factor [Polyangiaceae bacterium]|nr:response regulator transcription factor [Polyangiaceae bacterium]